MLSEISRSLKITIIGGSIPERTGDKLYNTCCVFGTDGKLMAKHRKVCTFAISFGKSYKKNTQRRKMIMTQAFAIQMCSSYLLLINLFNCFVWNSWAFLCGLTNSTRKQYFADTSLWHWHSRKDDFQRIKDSYSWSQTYYCRHRLDKLYTELSYTLLTYSIWSKLWSYKLVMLFFLIGWLCPCLPSSS